MKVCYVLILFNVILRRPNFLQAKWEHVLNFGVRSGDEYNSKFLKYFCVLTIAFVQCFAKEAKKYNIGKI